jgi:hypothetical protein
MTAIEQLQARIKAAVDKENANQGKGSVRQLRKDLSEIRWAMKVSGLSHDLYCCLDENANCYLTDDIEKAQTFDGRDNENLKLAYWSAALNEPLEIVLLEPELIDINALTYAQSKQYKWKGIEPEQRKGEEWSQKCQCQKTGAMGIRRGFYL